MAYRKINLAHIVPMLFFSTFSEFPEVKWLYLLVCVLEIQSSLNSHHFRFNFDMCPLSRKYKMESVMLSRLGSPDFKAKPIPSGVVRPGTEKKSVNKTSEEPYCEDSELLIASVEYCKVRETFVKGWGRMRYENKMIDWSLGLFPVFVAKKLCHMYRLYSGDLRVPMIHLSIDFFG